MTATPRRAPLLLAAAALALASALVVPATEVLAPGIRSLHEDLADGDFKPLEGTPFEPVPGTEVDGPAYGDRAGGITGESDGNYLPTPSGLPPRWNMDRDGTPGDVTIDYVFQPALGAMKRLKAYDAVAPGHVLEVADPSLHAVAKTPGLKYDQVFVGRFPVRLSPDAPTPIYSPGPDAFPFEATTSPSVPGGVSFLKDGADTFYVRARDPHFDGVVQLTVRFEAPSSYYDILVPPGLTLGAYGARPTALDPALQAKAERVLASLGLDAERRVDRVVAVLTDHFAGFGEGPIPPPTEYQDLYEAIAYGENGCCRHRAYAFMVTAQAAGIPTRVVVNEAHAFVEVFVPTRGWQQVNLGGCGSYTVNNPHGASAHHAAADDPSTPARAQASPVGAIPTDTLLTAWSPDVRKGTPFEVRGRVLDATGAPVDGMRVDLFVNATKEQPGTLVGRGTTVANGTFRIVASIARETPAASYQLVAHAKDLVNDKGAWRGSWSDPEIRVETATHFVLDLPKADGADLPVPMRAWLLDVLDGPVPGARVRLVLDDATYGEAVTDAQGLVQFDPVFHSRGTHRVLFDFKGDAYRDASEARTTIEILDTSLDVPRVLRGVRGEVVTLEGHVLRDGVGLAGRSVRVALPFGADGRDGARSDATGAFATTTDASGRFAVAFVARSATAPGEHAVVVEETELGLARTVALRLDVRTTLDVQVNANGTRATVRLVDDAGAPLAGETVHVDFGKASTANLTDALGTVVVDLGAPRAGEHAVRARFDGRGPYLADERETLFSVRAAPVDVDPRVAAAVLLVLAVAGAVVALVSRVRLRARLRAWAAARRRRRGTALRIVFPGLEGDVPPVVAPGEPFAVRVVAARHDGRPLADASVQVAVAGANVRVRTDASGAAELRLPGRAAGAVEIRARHGGGEAVAVVRVAEYRRALEETWHALVEAVARRGVAVDRTTTPRVFESVVAARADPRVVAPLVGLVEVNGFSRRPIGRREYVAFARAAHTVESKVEEAERGT